MSMEKLDIINIFNIIAKKKKSVPELSVLHSSSEFSAPFFFFYLLKLFAVFLRFYFFIIFFLIPVVDSFWHPSVFISFSHICRVYL